MVSQITFFQSGTDSFLTADDDEEFSTDQLMSESPLASTRIAREKPDRKKGTTVYCFEGFPSKLMPLPCFCNVVFC